MGKLLQSFRKIAFPWRLNRFENLILSNDTAGLEAFLETYPAAITWEKVRPANKDMAREERRHSFLQEAVMQAKPQSVEVLLKHGASVHTLNMEGYTALQVALGLDIMSAHADELQIKIAGMLVAHGAQLSQKSSRGKTALEQSLGYQNIDATGFLLGRGAKLKDAVSKDGGRALEICLNGFVAYKNPQQQEKMLAWLLRNTWADTEQENRHGMTPLFYAYSKQLAKLLIAAGANIAHADAQGRTPVTSMKQHEPDRANFMASAVEERRRYEEAKIKNACHRSVAAGVMQPLKLKIPTTS